MNTSGHSDPAERSALMRLFYRNWRPTRLGRWVNRLMCWWSGLGLPPRFQAALEVRGRASGHRRSNPVVIATVEGKRYLVSMLGAESDWVKNVEAARGDAVIRHGRRRRVHLTALPPEERAPISPRVRANRSERPTALPAPRGSAAIRFRGDRWELSCVSDRSVRTSNKTCSGDIRPAAQLRSVSQTQLRSTCCQAKTTDLPIGITLD